MPPATRRRAAVAPPLPEPDHLPATKGEVAEVRAEVAEVKIRMGAYEKKVDQLHATLQHGAQTSAENNLLLHKVLLAVQGQREPGLEIPGLMQTVADMRREWDGMKVANQERDVSLSARRGWLAGAIAVGGLALGAAGTWLYNTLISLLPHAR